MFKHFFNKRFLLMGVFPKFFSQEEILVELEEMESLVNTYGGQVFALAVQKGERPSQATYLRSGKIQQANDSILKERIDIVVCKDYLKPGQMFTLEKIFNISNPDIQVWDKAFLILHIFDLHATSAAAKLQIKIASLKHMGPRLYGMGYILSDQGGGIGIKGIGETNTEIMRRHWRNEIYSLKNKIKDLEKKRQIMIDRRQKLGLKTVSIIGYTNSGKSTLFNQLSGKKNTVDDKLFVTLDSTSAKLFFTNSRENAILTDTIGFIRNLPPFLIDTFKSTLMESVHSDIILLLIDAADPDIYNKIQTVEKVAYELNLARDKMIYVFNKTDKSDNSKKDELCEKYKFYTPVFISALTGKGISELKRIIEEKLVKQTVRE